MNIPYNIPWSPTGIFISRGKLWLRVWICGTWSTALGCVSAVQLGDSWLNDTAQVASHLEPCDQPHHREVVALGQCELRVARYGLS